MEPSGVDTELARALAVAEFEYASRVAAQNNEERAKASQLFAATFLTLAAALFTSKADALPPELTYRAFSIVFVVICAFGAVTLLMLMRFRLAWLDAAAAMNSIKLSAASDHSELLSSIRWQRLPPTFNPHSIGFLLAISVALLICIAASAATAFHSLANNPKIITVDWWCCFSTGLISSLSMLGALYCLPLHLHSSQR